MILYKSSALQFCEKVEENVIVESIEFEYIKKLGRHAPEGEKRAWNNSSRFMETVIRKSKIP